MKQNHYLRSCLFAAGLLGATVAYGQEIITWTATTGNLFDAPNWDLNRVPSGSDILVINNGGTATVGAVGNRSFGTVRLGDVQDSATSGLVIMTGGFLRIGEAVGDPKAVIGFSAELSTFIMNGGTIFHDGPDQHPGSTSDDGVNGLDWEVGERGFGRFEMHNNAIFRGGDDLKVGANGAGHGSVLIDGQAILSVGSGISVSEGGPSVEQLMIIGGNALVESGNSMGAGNPLGSTDEGYLTMAAGVDSIGRLVVQDNAVINFRRLSAREGTSIVTVKDRGQLHIFDVFNGKGFINATTAPDRPAETGPNSTFCSANRGDGTFTLQDDAQMTVNSDPASGPTKGLAISGPRDAGNPGGKAVLLVRDRASFAVKQDLALGTGAAESSDGTLTVIGSTPKVNIGGNLSLAVDLEGTPTPGKGTINPVITGATHAPINVAGTARLANGTLKVKLDGYTPVGGERYIIIQGGDREGQFLATNFSEAPLGAGLSWVVEYTASSVLLKVDPPVVVAPTIAISRNADGSLAVTFTGSLEVSPNVEGPYSPLPLNSPLKVVPGGDTARAFYRARN